MESALDLRWPKKEIIVIDDNSNDGTEIILQDFARRGKINLIKNSKKMGKGSAINKGAAFSHGELLLILDADTIIDKDALEKMVPRIQSADERLAMVSPRHIKAGRTKTLTEFTQVIHYASYSLFGRAQTILRRTMMVFGACMLIKRSVFQKIRFRTLLTEDFDFLLRLQMAGYYVDYAPVTVITGVPSKINEFCRQRSRWVKGEYQIFLRYGVGLFAKSWTSVYVALSRIMQVLGSLTFLALTALTVSGIFVQISYAELGALAFLIGSINVTLALLENKQSLYYLFLYPFFMIYLFIEGLLVLLTYFTPPTKSGIRQDI